LGQNRQVRLVYVYVFIYVFVYICVYVYVYFYVYVYVCSYFYVYVYVYVYSDLPELKGGGNIWWWKTAVALKHCYDTFHLSQEAMTVQKGKRGYSITIIQFTRTTRML